VMKPFDKSYD